MAPHKTLDLHLNAFEGGSRQFFRRNSRSGRSGGRFGRMRRKRWWRSIVHFLLHWSCLDDCLVGIGVVVCHRRKGRRNRKAHAQQSLEFHGSLPIHASFVVQQLFDSQALSSDFVVEMGDQFTIYGSWCRRKRRRRRRRRGWLLLRIRTTVIVRKRRRSRGRSGDCCGVWVVGIVGCCCAASHFSDRLHEVVHVVVIVERFDQFKRVRSI